ncbi:hypothetical protein [uncultured Ramlibacter sp.]|uniref:hypothetical protein n=1 Tax=uncultured Ramlibacter sp. TaxID=260755 RepID=UPI00261A3253|nr:hypothetical protein [uncultured Ramlibacter sp.]
MRHEPIQVLQAASRGVPAPVARPDLLIAGASGVLGNEVLRRLLGSQRFGTLQVTVREPMQAGLRGVHALLVEGDAPAAWPAVAAQVGVILFEPPRLFHDRERALWTPLPQQLGATAAWMRRSGVVTLAVVLPHAQGRLPEALKRGLAGLDEQAVAALGFERLLIIRSASKPSAAPAAHALPRLAQWMLSVLSFMVPSSEQPVRAAKVAELVGVALELAPPGIHVGAPELVWRAAQGSARDVAAQWLAR